MSAEEAEFSQVLQKAVVVIQNSLATLEGDINKLVADDKGLLAVVVFGLPPVYVLVALFCLLRLLALLAFVRSLVSLMGLNYALDHTKMTPYAACWQR